jgi:hypothetical protein
VARAYELAGMVKITQNAKATFAKVFGTENSTVFIGTFDAPRNLGSPSADTIKRNVRRRHRRTSIKQLPRKCRRGTHLQGALLAPTLALDKRWGHI